ncbi:MAG: hypothetical protein US31_C0002G0085 [Berkelbacteria bacterium GW2011_GWA1_36_9]|uniref:Transglutaminase-like domain-containing protein n=1 Tax=Berkelbacteria bacterium GW2011_GWA1_36_9 TaxID=1618331 RepID=A0A0G0FY73_9BACT|nr:MAG: hypothetical protein US31_C0002G0085 [Berkelbacteria bacterium GW2011_GWA1_36_9]
MLNKIFSSKIRLAILIFISILILALIGYFCWRQFIYLDPNSSKAYYKIFNKDEILDGNEDNATIVDQKLDKRLVKYHKTFAKMAGTTDERKLKALFYMNFVHMSAYYNERSLKELSIKELIWGGDYLHCGNYTALLAMLLDKSGYEFRTLAIYPGHGIIEIKLNDRWQVLDPTTNIWLDQSIEEQVAGKHANSQVFFLTATDEKNSKAREHMSNLKVKVSVIDLRDKTMLKIAPNGPVRIGQYNYIKLSDYKY